MISLSEFWCGDEEKGEKQKVCVDGFIWRWIGLQGRKLAFDGVEDERG